MRWNQGENKSHQYTSFMGNDAAAFFIIFAADTGNTVTAAAATNAIYEEFSRNLSCAIFAHQAAAW